ncbi:MAG: MbnP family protein [Bacteroidia bacterium]
MKTKLFSAFAGCLLIFSSCKKDEQLPPIIPSDPQGTVEVRFNPTINGSSLNHNEIVTGPNEQRIILETFKFYLSNIKATGSGNVLGSTDVALLDMSLSDKSFSFKADPGTITGLSFNVGLTPDQNGTNNPNFNPAAYENTNPLSVYNSMYWTWASGYIFLKIEGRTDTTQAQSSSPMFTWFYHCGLDTLLRSYDLGNMNISVEAGKTSVIELTFEFDDLFMRNNQPINMTDEYFTHTSDEFELAEDVITNFGTSIRKL